jgi:Tfp pilus assembly protein PilV
MPTFFATHRYRHAFARRCAAAFRSRLLASESGDTLIEVLISSVLIAVVVFGTLTGLDSNNRATALDRARSQADALAQQDEEQLRSEPISKLSELNRAKPIIANGTHYTVTSKAEYISNTTATSSCTSSSASADYIQTTSTVTWPSLGKGKPVTETSIVSPPPGTALIVQVLDSGAPVPNATVSVTGPSNISTETSAGGCAILQVLPGQYNINVSRSQYVDQNGYANTNEDSADIRNDYLVAETTTKVGYQLAPAGALKVSFVGSTPPEGDSFVAFNSGMTIFKPFGTLGTYNLTVTSTPTLFPFTSMYTVYAGTCEADNPNAVNASITDPEAFVPAGGTGSVAVTQPPINIAVRSGKSSSSPGVLIENAIVTLTDTGCVTKRESNTNSLGALRRPGAPYGKYTLCVTGGASGGNNGATTGLARNKTYTSLAFANDQTTGPSELKNVTNGGLSGGSAVIYMESGATGPGKLETGSACK